LYPNRPLIAYLPPTMPLQVVDSPCDPANRMVLQTIALPLGDRATGRNEPGQVKPGESEASPAQFPALDYNCKL
jgi:hypothetical protein